MQRELLVTEDEWRQRGGSLEEQGSLGTPMLSAWSWESRSWSSVCHHGTLLHNFEYGEKVLVRDEKRKMVLRALRL